MIQNLKLWGSFSSLFSRQRILIILECKLFLNESIDVMITLMEKNESCVRKLFELLISVNVFCAP